LPAPPITDVREYLNLGPGKWVFDVVHGGKDGEKVKTEFYDHLPNDPDGAEVWRRTIGTEYVEYWRIEDDGSFGKRLEDAPSMEYSSRFIPGVTWLSKIVAGKTHAFESKIESFKTKTPDKVAYTGKMHTELTYVGMYEVTTPAGVFPAILVKYDFVIKIGPAKVTDVMYVFVTKGVGKIAEIETTHVTALLIYNSSTKVAKVLKSYPKR
jgi:hypothetical protein